MKYIAIIFTFMLPHADPMEQRFEMKTKAACERFIGVPRKVWKTAPEDFLYQLECRKKETPQKS